MAEALFVRKALFIRMFMQMASAVGLISLSLLFVGLIPFLSAGPSVGAGFPVRLPATSVDREFKGDRLPLPSDANSAFSKNEPQRLQGSKAVQGPNQDPKEIPDGCDRSFSPITAPQLAHVFGRCTT
jgi:hypothetical protein